MLTELHEAGEQVLVVGDVEVPREDEVPCHPVALAHNGVAAVEAVLTVRAVAHVREQGLAAEGDVLADPLRVHLVTNAGLLRSLAKLVGRLLLHAPEEVLDGVRGDGLLAVDVLGPGRHVHGHARDAGAVLAAVALLLHQHVHAVEAEEVRAILLQVELRRLQQSDQGKAALMADLEVCTEILLDLVTHDAFRMLTRRGSPAGVLRATHTRA
mmetsp:Transcript_63384/g.166022  ORF Transcript_63384/g.166022 Transcript_63384/m.166022 type:complete len:212 (-) Transcript_63384:15-650(-)